MPKVLIADDESKIREFIGLFFKESGYDVIEAEDGKKALEKYYSMSPDLIILDIMMPFYDGFEVCSIIRKTSQVPIIILTALTQNEQYLHGYELGADDYVSKHVNPKIIVAKSKRLLSNAKNKKEIIEVKGIKIDKPGVCVYIDNSPISLSPKEFMLLVLLTENKNRVLTREYILEKIWNYSYLGDSRAVDTYVKKLRKKIAPYSNLIVTIISIGYKLEDK